MTTGTSEGPFQRLLDDEIEPFLEHRRAAGYADETVHRKRAITREFAQWAQQQMIVEDNLNSHSAAQFVDRVPQRAKTRVVLERATVRLFLEHLYVRGRLQCPTPKETDSGYGNHLRRYEDYLRKDRGLADNSVHVYLPFVREFLQAQSFPAGCLDQDAFDTLKIRSFLLEQIKDRSGEYIRPLATSVRSFLRFFVSRGRDPPRPLQLRSYGPEVPHVGTTAIFFHPNRPSVFWWQRTNPHRPDAAIMPCCSC